MYLNSQPKIDFNLQDFIAGIRAEYDCGNRNYKQDKKVITQLRRYIECKDRRYFYYHASTSIKFMNVPEKYSSVLDEICNAICTLISYAKAHKNIDENGMHLTIRLPYGKGRFYFVPPRIYQYKHKQYSIGALLQF